jgi:hypothetical protein
MAKLAPSLNDNGWDEMFSKEGVIPTTRFLKHFKV